MNIIFLDTNSDVTQNAFFVWNGDVDKLIENIKKFINDVSFVNNLKTTNFDETDKQSVLEKLDKSFNDGMENFGSGIQLCKCYDYEGNMFSIFIRLYTYVPNIHDNKYHLF